MPRYRIYLMDEAEFIQKTAAVECHCDAEAMDHARTLIRRDGRVAPHRDERLDPARIQAVPQRPGPPLPEPADAGPSAGNQARRRAAQAVHGLGRPDQPVIRLHAVVRRADRRVGWLGDEAWAVPGRTCRRTGRERPGRARHRQHPSRPTAPWPCRKAPGTGH